MKTSKTNSLATWKKVAGSSADPQRVQRFLEDFEERYQGAPHLDKLLQASPEHARILAALVSGAKVMGERLLVHPEWLEDLSPEHLERPRHPQGLRREIKAWLEPALEQLDYAGALTRLRRFKQHEMCRIAARDLGRLAGAVEITEEVSQVADVCLDSVLKVCRHRLEERWGRPYHQESGKAWFPTQFDVLGLGKLGGRELNYSSDVDLMFVYTEEGHVFKSPPRAGAKPGSGLTNHQYFHRLAEAFVLETTRPTEDGTLYRIDLRLRPEGDSGPLVRSLPSCEIFYAQWGQTWERMMLIKARCVAGECELAGEFLEMIQPFRFPRFLHDRALDEIVAMKARTEKEVVRAGEMDRNVKLGRGGIREIEFIVQTTQILHGGRLPFLQGYQTIPTLEKMVQYELLPEKDAQSLTAAYCFFRDVEHRLQMDQELQTHTIPDQKASQERLARLMGFRSARVFEEKRRSHAGIVHRIYRRQLRMDCEKPATKNSWPRDLIKEKDAWESIMANHGFRDPQQSRKLLQEFVLGPGYVHISPRTSELAWDLVDILMSHCLTKDGETSTFNPGNEWLSDPDRVLSRLDRFISAYGARSMLFETWAHNTTYFELVIRLFDRSEFLAERAIHTPDLVDDLIQSGHLNRRKTADETLNDLRLGNQDKDQFAWIRRYQQTELMRIGLRDILGLVNFELNQEELSNLADASLQYALETALRRRRLKKCPMTVIGLGKLGGRELNYGSDLDIIFVANPKATNLVTLEKVASDLMSLLSRRTENGIAFETDARLRPDGEKGLLVNTLDRFEEYYRHRAQLWEIQALTRTRPVAGDVPLGTMFQNLVGTLTDFSPPHVEQNFVRIATIKPGSIGESASSTSGTKKRARGKKSPDMTGLAAYTAGWKEEIARMRLRIEKERTEAGQDALAIKTGKGGLIDAEFIAQAFCLEQGWQEPNTEAALKRIQKEKRIPSKQAAMLIKNYTNLRRVEGVLRRWSIEGERKLPADPAAFQRVAVRCGFTSADLFRAHLQTWRQGIRQIFEKVFPMTASLATPHSPDTQARGNRE